MISRSGNAGQVLDRHVHDLRHTLGRMDRVPLPAEPGNHRVRAVREPECCVEPAIGISCCVHHMIPVPDQLNRGKLTGWFAITLPVQETSPPGVALLTVRFVTESTGTTVRLRLSDRVRPDCACREWVPAGIRSIGTWRAKLPSASVVTLDTGVLSRYTVTCFPGVPWERYPNMVKKYPEACN